jgi:hypothetical protein
MGLGNNNQMSKRFITIVGGKFTLRVPEGTDGATMRVLTKEGYEGKEVWEKYFDHVDGMLVGGELHEGKFGTDLCLDIKDDVIYTVQIPVNSPLFEQFAKCVPNIDPTNWLFLGLGYDKGRDKHFLYIKQGKNHDVSVHSAYTKDNPNGLPPAVEKKVMGKIKWDFEAQKEFLYGNVVDFLGMLSESKPESNQDERDSDSIPF